MGVRVGLSTSSVYPGNVVTAFEVAAELGYDAIEVMVWTDPLSQNSRALQTLQDRHGLPVAAIHAPTLLMTQRVWGPDPWRKIDRSIELAQRVGAGTVVLHPPFRWQREYAAGFVDGVALREDRSGVMLAVENMYPWRAGGRQLMAYLPHWDPVEHPFDHVTLDLSHTATAGSDALAMVRALGPRLVHIHLADGSGAARDEHLVPGRGGQPCAEVLRTVADTRVAKLVVVEVSTRRADPETRSADLGEALAFARRNTADRPTRKPASRRATGGAAADPR